jgi:sterol desaturase/sphingolipid hydroxylase (fatty acid hydroxylase superfamily)
MMEAVAQAFARLQQWIFEGAVLPVAEVLGLSGYAEQLFDGTELFLVGVLEIALLLVLVRPLELWRPVERWSDRRAVRTDVLYTLLHRLGLIPLAIFFLMRPLLDGFDGWLRLQGFVPPNLEDWVPALAASPVLAFFVYLVILDLAEYWRHRLQHRWAWWWSLHALHHSQREMTLWTDDRNHLLDDVIAKGWFAIVALAIGVPPGQFVMLVVATRLIESLSHANVRMSFGRIGDRILVSPRFHRVHHAIGSGHEGPARGCNFAQLFSFWDVLFGTAKFETEYPRTGIRDQLAGRDYGEGFWRQQWLGLVRLVRANPHGPGAHDVAVVDAPSGANRVSS